MTFLFIFTLLNYINDYLYLKVKFEILNKMNIPQQHDVQLCFGFLPSERERQRHELKPESIAPELSCTLSGIMLIRQCLY